jgi:hypothetical protein
MCRCFSAETEEALRDLINHENGADVRKDIAERRVLNSLLTDPYQLEIVRRAVRFYLEHNPANYAEELAWILKP